MSRPLIFLLLFLLFCLPACSKQAGLGTSSNPFAVTGLLAHPDETAEEILIRAHKQDTDAIVLARAGYALGINGFPQDTRLARLYPLKGQEYTNGFLDIMEFRPNLYLGLLPPTPKRCAKAGYSPYAPVFKQAGVFDLDSVCADIGYDQTVSPVSFYDRAVADNPNKVLIELISRPMRPKDVEDLKLTLKPSDVRAHEEYIGQVIATAGNKNATPTERKINLLRFITQREKEPFAESAMAREAALNTLMQTAAADSNEKLTSEIIRKAHQGDPVAARQMAENYRTGAMGFPKVPYMAFPWLRRAAIAGDENALENYVLWHYNDGLLKYAWAYAQIGLRYGGPEHEEVYNWIIEETGKRFTAEQLQSFQSDVDRALAEMRAEGYKAE